MRWSSQGRSMDPSFQLMWGAPSLQLGHSCLQLVVKLLGRPSQLTVAIYTSYLHGHKHSIRSIFSFNAFCQNLKPVIIGKVSREMSHTGTNIKNALNPLVSFNAVNKPVQVQVIGCVDTHLSNLASLHISCCFLGFTCFLNTWRRPRS